MPIYYACSKHPPIQDNSRNLAHEFDEEEDDDDDDDDDDEEPSSSDISTLSITASSEELNSDSDSSSEDTPIVSRFGSVPTTRDHTIHS